MTGGNGFVGGHVVAALEAKGHQVCAPSHLLCNLLIRMDALMSVSSFKPDAVVHLAARVGGIGANMASPATFWAENLQMGIYILEVCRRLSIRKTVILGTTCSYPKLAQTPFVEEALFTGYPEETNAPYGIAKLAILEGCRAYRRQWGMESTFLIPTNMYGPGDNFDPETSHVIPAMIRKMHEAKVAGAKTVTLWGDGTPTRDFLYAPDAAEAIVAAVEGPDVAVPVNLGSGQEVSMASLCQDIRKVVGYEGEIYWDHSKPNGQPRRCLDITKAQRLFGWRAKTWLLEGLKNTYESFLRGDL